MTESCSTCRFWKPFPQWANLVSPAIQLEVAGPCRRRAPSVPRTVNDGQYPVTVASDWCGEYEPVKSEQPTWIEMPTETGWYWYPHIVPEFPPVIVHVYQATTEGQLLGQDANGDVSSVDSMSRRKWLKIAEPELPK